MVPCTYVMLKYRYVWSYCCCTFCWQSLANYAGVTGARLPYRLYRPNDFCCKLICPSGLSTVR